MEEHEHRSQTTAKTSPSHPFDALDPSSSSPTLTTSGWLRSWRYFFWGLGLGVLILLFFAEENWRGKWMWTRYQEALARQGTAASITAFIPPAVRDEDNFASTPLLAPLFEFIPGTQRPRDVYPRLDAAGLSPAYHEAGSRIRTDRASQTNSWAPPMDFAAWAAAFHHKTPGDSLPREGTNVSHLSDVIAAKEILAVLAESDAFLDELRLASRRPESRFNLRYGEDNPASILLPHLAVLKRACAILQLRASAELALKMSDKAGDDVNLCFYLANAFKSEPILISQLVRMAQIPMALQPLAEGMNQWSEAQLRRFEELLSQFDFMTDMRRTLEGERFLFGLGFIDYLMRASSHLELLSRLQGAQSGQPNGEDIMGIGWMVAPRGWFYFEKVNYCRAFEDYLLPPLELNARRINPAVCRRSDREIQNLLNHAPLTLFLRHRFFSQVFLPSLPRTFEKVAFAQSGVDLARIACALQRYRLERGDLPDTLDLLVPKFIAQLPHDIITGEPLKYQKLSGVRYLLYSVGWNEMDEGGSVVTGGATKGPRNTEGIEQLEGDWVWCPIVSE